MRRTETIEAFAGKVTGSSLGEALGLFEPAAGKVLVKAGVYSKMRDPAKLQSKVASLQNSKHGPAEVDAQTQVYFDWGHKHEANGILSYLKAHPRRTVHEVGFVLLDPSLKSLPAEVRKGVNAADLPVIGSSPDGIIVEHAQPVHKLLHQHWREFDPSRRHVLEIKAKTPFRPDAASGTWWWLGRKCTPHSRILPQYFAQAQLNMLVTGCDSCHLLCYTVTGGSVEFNIALHKQWCNDMLHWLSELNTQYIVKGLAPPLNVFWEQEAYRVFVRLTRDACVSLDNTVVPVDSHHGSESSPLFCPAVVDGVVPNTPPELDGVEASQPQQQQHSTHRQQPPQWQQQQRQEQSLISSSAGYTAAAQVPHSMLTSAVPTSALPLHIAAAAIPLLDEDSPMDDAEPLPAPEAEGCITQPQEHHQQPQGHEQEPHRVDPSGPIGPQGLAAWMQHILHHLCVDLKPVLDFSCQKALSVLAVADVQGALERIAKDVKAGWPHNASALCMQRIRHLRPPAAAATSPGATDAGPGAAANRPEAAGPGPSAAVRSQGPPASVATRSPGVPATSPGTASLGPGRSVRSLGPDALCVGSAASSPQGPVAKSGLLPSAPWSAPPRLAFASTTDAGPMTTPPRFHFAASDSGHAVTNSALRQLWPDTGLSYAGGPAQQPGPDTLPDVFGGRPIPVAMSQGVRARLQSVVAEHHLYLRAEDFDECILARLAHMPEGRAMSVLQQAENAKWPSVRDNTRLIMYWCCKMNV